MLRNILSFVKLLITQLFDHLIHSFSFSTELINKSNLKRQIEKHLTNKKEEEEEEEKDKMKR